MRTRDVGLGSLYKTKRGYWTAAFTVGYDGKGRQVRRTVSAKTQSRVLEKRRQLLRELEESSTAPEKITVETWMQRWLDTTAFEKLNPRVLADYRSKNRLYITPTLGSYRLRDLGADEVRELHAAARQAGLSDRTVQIVHTVLSTALSDAVREGKIDQNPCERVGRPRARSRQRQALSVMHARKVIIAAFEEEDPLASMWASFLFLGARKAELIGLEWSRLDLEFAAVDLSWQVQSIPWAHGEECGCEAEVRAARCPKRRHAVPPGFEYRELYRSRLWTRPKTVTSMRVTPIPAPLVAALTVYREKHVPNPHGLVWAGADGRPLMERAVSAGWREACRRAGAPPVDLHSARHTTATLLLESQVPPEVISQILGHSSVISTRPYLHVGQAQATAAMDALGSYLRLPGLE
ncbi:tyrosine-type recombinase/integrase [Corynebacterium sp. TAE3-ERU16]|uniref:tyrosine-type recombinase/integrase n=1 Tax=Corynebacterium sp. TAE3-ERU16 TaxID=2849493 RepID=UPI001C4714A4|nr:tyrosine-type recombinase/integrase [Corynebacterium sp. TAE3-ERU16]MBV7292327.1 tyrosine-type recombinase/integrase [Corynebacterium sp. TAE3-ERU16]